MSDFVREVGQNETDAWLEVDRLRAQQTAVRGALQLSDSALTVAVEIAAKVFEEARGVERSGSPGEAQWEDMHQIDHALKKVKEALATLDVEEKM